MRKPVHARAIAFVAIIITAVALLQPATASSLLDMFKVPAAGPLPSVQKQYSVVFELGKGPDLSSIIDLFSIYWDLTNKKLFDFSFSRNTEPLYHPLSPTQTFSQPQPSFSLSGTGIAGLDGSFYIRVFNNALAWVEKSGAFAIIWAARADYPDPAVFPFIILNGDSLQTMYIGDSYVDSGATAYDYIDGDLTSKISMTGRVDPGTVGTYTLTYSVADADGNKAAAARKVIVLKDTLPPRITLKGDNPQWMPVHTPYREKGATATDNRDGNLTDSIKISSTVDTAVADTYAVTYTVSDRLGNRAVSTRSVIVMIDTVKPVFNLWLPNPYFAYAGYPFVFKEPGFNAWDNCDGNVAASVVTTAQVTTSDTGTFQMLYTVSDIAGNVGSAVRVIKVIRDTVPPVVSIIGSASPTIFERDPFIDSGATARDNADTTVRDSVHVSGSVNANVPGTYILTYTAADRVGNIGTARRTVTVARDTLPPAITLKGGNPMTVWLGDPYIEPGATASEGPGRNFSDSIHITGTVNTSIAGTSLVRYSCSDRVGNVAQEVRTVIVSAGDGAPRQFLFNQIGYFSGGSKIAIITGPGSVSFSVRNASTGSTAFTGTLGAGSIDTRKKIHRTADFSALTTPGSYYLQVDTGTSSAAFTVADTLYNAPLRTVLKSFYFQRCSYRLDPAFAGKWARNAGHPDTACIFHPSTGKTGIRSSPGGWYDAGDYGKYVISAAISAGMLLQICELFRDAVFDDAGIPESHNGLCDILDEAKYELNWLKTMQDDDGGVFHKLTTLVFDGFIMPDSSIADRYIFAKSTPATYNFAAVMALASRLYRDSAWSADCIARAEKAWAWALANPSIDFSNPAGVNTGEYNGCRGAAKWAAAELYASTGNDVYKTAVGSFSGIYMPITWDNEENLAAITLARKTLSRDITLQHAARRELVACAARLLQTISSSRYRIPMTSSNFYWGSNGIACAWGIMLAYGYYLTGDSHYLNGAIETIDYIFGKNPLCKSFVTGLGSNPPRNPHHRPSAADGIAEPVPGLIVGGPNSGRQDGLPYGPVFPEMCYLDTVLSYASNEPAINWSAPLLFMIDFLKMNFAPDLSTRAGQLPVSGIASGPNGVRHSFDHALLKIWGLNPRGAAAMVRIFNCQGRLVAESRVVPSGPDNRCTVHCSGRISPGVFLCAISQKGFRTSFKFLAR